MPIDRFKRYQNNLSMGELYPDIRFKCACGCGKNLSGRRTRWANDDCRKKAVVYYWIVKGNQATIRIELSKRDKIDGKNYCAFCKTDVTYTDWEADHILEVRHGGGGCGLENFQIVCKECHKKKTKANFAKSEKTLDLFG